MLDALQIMLDALHQELAEVAELLATESDSGRRQVLSEYQALTRDLIAHIEALRALVMDADPPFGVTVQRREGWLERRRELLEGKSPPFSP